MKKLLEEAADRSIRYIQSLEERDVFPSDDAINNLTQFDESLPAEPTDPETILQILDDIGSPATVASAGGRYFGFVVGGSLPATVAVNWLASAWDQNDGMSVLSPVAVALEQVCLKWLIDVFSLPPGTWGGLVSGATMANFSGLAAARHAILQKQGWDVESRGLFGAPPVNVVVGEEVHVSALKALSLLGFGRERLIRVAVDHQGRMRADALPKLDSATIICIQAGNVNTGAFDPAREVCETAREADAWVHVDGAFGLWAAAAPDRAHLYQGFEAADSWATDAHKWLNVPYDCGIVFCRTPEHLKAAMSTSAAYLVQGDNAEPHHYVPEMSRRARSIEVWAALRSLGKKGLADMIERTCRFASRMASELKAAGYHILNDVVINQVLVSFGDAETTRRVIERVQAHGTCWCGGTQWQGHTAMRVSVSSWATSDADVGRSIDAILKIAADEVGT
jgi:glutamate/tyrosine decarboxylase-like PLP-dependent enzyme